MAPLLRSFSPARSLAGREVIFISNSRGASHLARFSRGRVRQIRMFNYGPRESRERLARISRVVASSAPRSAPQRLSGALLSAFDHLEVGGRSVEKNPRTIAVSGCTGSRTPRVASRGPRVVREMTRGASRAICNSRDSREFLIKIISRTTISRTTRGPRESRETTRPSRVTYKNHLAAREGSRR